MGDSWIEDRVEHRKRPDGRFDVIRRRVRLIHVPGDDEVTNVVEPREDQRDG